MMSSSGCSLGHRGFERVPDLDPDPESGRVKKPASATRMGRPWGWAAAGVVGLGLWTVVIGTSGQGWLPDHATVVFEAAARPSVQTSTAPAVRGWVDVTRRSSAGAFDVRGWLTSSDDEVEAAVDGVVAGVRGPGGGPTGAQNDTRGAPREAAAAQAWVAALDRAQLVPAATWARVATADTRLAGLCGGPRVRRAFAFAGQYVLVCANGPDQWRVVGDEFEALVTTTATPSRVDHTQVDAVVEGCRDEMTADSLQGSSAAWDEAEAEDTDAALGAWLSSAGSGEQPQTTDDVESLWGASSAAAPRCVFLHGAGNQHDEPPAQDDQVYWGRVKAWTPQCRSHTFMLRDTTNVPWTDEALQQHACDLVLDRDGGGGGDADPAAAAATPEGPPVLVFGHSMGNLVLAGAMANDRCGLRDGVDAWFAAQGPMDGSPAADYALELCQNDSLMTLLSEELGYCVPDPSSPDHGHVSSQAFQSMVQADAGPELERAYAAADRVAKKHVSGALCGTSPQGIPSRYSLPLLELSKQVAFPSGEASDGVVGWLDCANAQAGFQHVHDRTWDGRSGASWYRAGINHMDGTCRDGNSWWDPRQMPCKWYRQRKVPVPVPGGHDGGV